MVVAVYAVGAPEDILHGDAVVARFQPHEERQHVHHHPQMPLLAIDEYHQYLCEEGGHGGESIKVGLGVVGVTAEQPAAQRRQQDAHQRHPDKRVAAQLARLHFVLLLSAAFELTAPYKYAVNHRNEIEHVHRYLGIEMLQDAEVSVGDDLRKAEEIVEDVALRAKHHGEDAAQSAHERPHAARRNAIGDDLHEQPRSKKRVIEEFGFAV